MKNEQLDLCAKLAMFARFRRREIQEAREIIKAYEGGIIKDKPDRTNAAMRTQLKQDKEGKLHKKRNQQRSSYTD